MAAQMILGLSILVGLHEAGHMLAAKFFGMRVEQFSIGFPPKLFGKKFGDTEYSLGLIPLGGFVKISGMIDESLDTDQINEEPKDYEFRSKPAWQRLIVMLGGIIMNVITGIVIFVVLTYSQGDTYLSKNAVNVHGIEALELGKQLGFKNGDKIINIDGKDFEQFSDVVNPEILMSENGYYTVLRGNETIKIEIPSDMMNRFVTEQQEVGKGKGFILPLYPFKVGQISLGSGAAKAGLEPNDVILSIDGKDVHFFNDLKPILTKEAGKKVNLLVDRNGKQLNLQAQISEDGLLGFVPKFTIKESHKSFTFGQSLSAGTEKAFAVVITNVKAFGKMFSGELNPTKSLSGPIGIAQQFGGTWDWVRFWTLTGLLSMVLAFMNLLPIPALDGGHVTFLLFEMVSGRKPSDKFMEYAQKVGMIILLGLMVFVFSNDIIKLFK